jgi:hypothetical protein
VIGLSQHQGGTGQYQQRAGSDSDALHELSPFDDGTETRIDASEI